MSGRGKNETDRLRANMEATLNRLMAQLKDLEELRDDLDDDEYEETKADTLEQLREFEATLQKTVAGDVTLVDSLGSVQLAIQAAVRQAFHTPEVISLFAKKQPGQLRTRLSNLERALKLRSLSEDAYNAQAVEILSALKKLGEPLSGEEQQFLQTHMTSALKEFEAASSGMGDASQQRVIDAASSQVKQAQG